MKFSVIATLIFFALFTIATNALPVETNSIRQVNVDGTVVNDVSGYRAIAASSVKSTHNVVQSGSDETIASPPRMNTGQVIQRRRANPSDEKFQGSASSSYYGEINSSVYYVALLISFVLLL